MGSSSLSSAGREVWDYLPIQSLNTPEVFGIIRDSSRGPHKTNERHKRLSCVFCIKGCGNDLAHGAEQRTELYAKIPEIEKRTSWTMFNGKLLKDRAAEGQARQEPLADVPFEVEVEVYVEAAPQMSFGF